MVIRFAHSFAFFWIFCFVVNGHAVEPEIKNCNTEYYDITGENGNALLAEMRKKNRTEGGYFAHTRYNYNNTCSALKTTCKVRLPRWVNLASSANEPLKVKWQKFIAALVAHEQGHVDIFNRAMAFAEKKSKDQTCVRATTLYQITFARIRKQQKAYDRKTDHGKKLGAAFAGSNYMGIAFSAKNNAAGIAFDQETKEQAKIRSLAECNSADCKFVVWASGRESCVSLARGMAGGYGYAYGKGQEDAETKAIDACEDYDDECTVRKTVCASTDALN